MRLHRLEVTAFGPFGDTVEVDFDALSDAGLFLLGGATGAGKSSVLDAVCFALYGRVPGVRDGAKRLHSDHAAADLAPRVVLDLTVAGRRLRVDRSPAWLRPKRRGTGTTPEKPRVLVTESVSDDEPPVTRAARADEAGHFLDGLLGMNLGQFTQVAMLPQGDVEAFLRAESKDRQALLQKLFRTDRFAAVETWLREHRVRVRRRHDAATEVLADHLSRLSEAAAEPVPAEWADDLRLAADDGRLLAWAADLHADATLTIEAVGLAVDAAAAEAAEARRRHDTAVDRHDHLTRARAADERRRLLRDAEPEIDLERRRRDDARRAEPMRSLHDEYWAAMIAQHEFRQVVREAEMAAARAQAELTGRLEGRPAPTTGSDLDRVAERLDDAIPRAVRLTEIRHDEQVLGAERHACDERVEAARERAASAPERVEAARCALAESQHALEALPESLAAVELARSRVAARATADELAPAVRAANADLATARDETLRRRAHVLDLRERRLAGIAAELAGGLAAGCSCPVCGSAEHPAAARPVDGAPTEADERTAERLVDDAHVVEEAHRDQVRLLEQRAVAALARCDEAPASSLAAELRAAEQRSATTARLADRHGPDATELAAAEADAASIDGELTSATSRQVALAERLTALGAERGALLGVLDELAEARGPVPVDDPDGLAALAAGYREAATRAHAHEAAAADHRRRHDQLHRTERVLHHGARSAGFADADAARDAMLIDEELAQVEDRIATHERELAGVTAVLTELGVGPDDGVAVEPPPDTDASGTALADAVARLDARRAEHVLAIRSARRLAALHEQLATAVTAWRPVADELALAVRMAALVDGSSPDNELRVSLSAFVLGHRLAQVVDAANVRLAPMMAHRYRLEHTSHRASGDRRGGLSLLVRDTWTGEARDPATLSGGETFVVSLALALGLADVVSAEAGGATLDTLFVDEGFGALDADTLDDVLDVLDSLRAGGRVVGVVSHVTGMRDRIPTRLEVHKARTGSSVSMS